VMLPFGYIKKTHTSFKRKSESSWLTKGTKSYAEVAKIYNIFWKTIFTELLL
jgi:hypothetical protein